MFFPSVNRRKIVKPPREDLDLFPDTTQSLPDLDRMAPGAEVQSELNTSTVTPEKIAMMKLNGLNNEYNRDVFSEPTTPTLQHKSLNFTNGHARSSSLVRSGSRRTVTRSSSRRSSSFMASHRSKMSAELTAQAEGKFFALMDFMASASREASSLKEFWQKILAEREAFAQEREELMQHITEITEELEVQEAQHRGHGHDAGERKKQVDKLLIELSAAIASASSEKKKVIERDNELDRTRRELEDIRSVITRTRTEYEKIRSDFEASELSLRTAEGDRDSARDEADRHHRELQRVIRERSEISSKFTDVTSKHEISRKEVLSLQDRIKMYDVEREEYIHELDRTREDARKARLRAEDSAKEVLEITERHDRLSREISKLRENIRVIELERDDHTHTLESLRREIKTIGVARDEADEKYSEINLKYDHIKRELLSAKEKLRDVELERNENFESLERSREQHRVLLIERDELRDEVTSANRKVEDNRRQVVLLAESLRKAESTITDIRSEVYTLNERIKHISSERDDARGKHGLLHTEIAELKESITVFQAEIRNISAERDHVRGDLERVRRDYEEITETITTFKDDSGELEFEIESLRTMLREAREQKESAISARGIADRERDEAIAKYEEKCRELERFEESAAAHYRAHGRSEARTSSSRIVSRSSTTVNNSG